MLTGALSCTDRAIGMNSGHTYVETIAPPAAGRTVLEHMTARWRHGSAPEWRERLARGELTLDGVAATGDERLEGAMRLAWARPPWVEPEVPLSFALLHRDADFLAVAKPAGLPTLPSGGRFLTHTLLHRVQRHWPEATPLHRLDRGTSGVVLFARTADARRLGSAAFQDVRGRRVRRIYRGLVQGSLRDDEVTIREPIGSLPHPRLGRVFAVVADGKPATTHVRVLERRATSTLVAIEIESGRPHQIRIHLAHIGHPLIGEPFFTTHTGSAPASDPDPHANPGDLGYLLHAERCTLSPPPPLPPLDVWCSPPPTLMYTHPPTPV